LNERIVDAWFSDEGGFAERETMTWIRAEPELLHNATSSGADTSAGARRTRSDTRTTHAHRSTWTAGIRHALAGDVFGAAIHVACVDVSGINVRKHDVALEYACPPDGYFLDVAVFVHHVLKQVLAAREDAPSRTRDIFALTSIFLNNAL